MEQSRRRRRTAAGRSGGIFEKSTDATGILTYRYRFQNKVELQIGTDEHETDSHSLGETESEEVNENNKNDCTYERQTAQLATSPDTDQTSKNSCDTRDEMIQDTPVKQDESTDKVVCDTAAKKPRWFKPIRALKGKALKFRTRARGGLSKLKSASGGRETIFPDYTTNLHEETAYVNGADRSILEGTVFQEPAMQSDQSTMSSESRVEHSYFTTKAHLYEADVDFEFFCSFPDSDFGEMSNSDINTETTEENGSFDKFLSAQKSRQLLSPRDMRNHYEVLGLDKDCDSREITLRARHLMSSLHPDKLSTRTEQQINIDTREFARVSLAKTELLDIVSRVIHDRQVASGSWEGVPWT